ncbi:MAG: glycosyltransferase family 2 protein [Propionibacteriaceae bacterium]|nr:glycosyltransferase family 2 protein [Propionibacteriaceae bacterium]
MKVTDTALIVCAYNEGSVIRETLSEAVKHFTYVVCVDDGSSDNTFAEAKEAGAIVLRHSMNLGQGATLQTGVEYALRLPVTYFVSFDADGQHRIEDVLAMRETILDKQVDVIFGSRFLGTSHTIPLPRRILLRCAVIFSNWTSGVKLTDAHNGLRLFTRPVAEAMDFVDTGYRHASEFTEIVADKKFTYVEQPVTILYTDYSKSKGQSGFNAINIVADTLLARTLRR